MTQVGSGTVAGRDHGAIPEFGCTSAVPRHGPCTSDGGNSRRPPGDMARSHSVLVVDDDPAVRDLIADALRESGHQVDEATDGADALQRLRDGVSPCVVLSDVRMPRMDGFELSREAGRDPELAAIPIVTFTGDRVLSFTTPARDKPFSSAELDALVQRACRLHRAPADGERSA